MKDKQKLVISVIFFQQRKHAFWPFIIPASTISTNNCNKYFLKKLTMKLL
jgi:hypothetical protein